MLILLGSFKPELAGRAGVNVVHLGRYRTARRTWSARGLVSQHGGRARCPAVLVEGALEWMLHTFIIVICRRPEQAGS